MSLRGPCDQPFLQLEIRLSAGTVNEKHFEICLGTCCIEKEEVFKMFNFLI